MPFTLRPYRDPQVGPHRRERKATLSSPLRPTQAGLFQPTRESGFLYSPYLRRIAHNIRCLYPIARLDIQSRILANER